MSEITNEPYLDIGLLITNGSLFNEYRYGQDSEMIERLLEKYIQLDINREGFGHIKVALTDHLFKLNISK